LTNATHRSSTRDKLKHVNDVVPIAAFLSPIVIFPISGYLAHKLGATTKWWVIALVVSAISWVGLMKATPDSYFEDMPAGPTAEQGPNEQCASDADDNNGFESDRDMRYADCDGHRWCMRKNDLSGSEIDCTEWRNWPTDEEGNEIDLRYERQHPDEFQNPGSPPGDGPGDYDYREPDQSECNGNNRVC
jgi:hypothetical protein